MKPIPLVDLKAQYRHIGREVRAEIGKVLASCGFVMSANEPDLFETQFAKACGVRDAVGCCNGTAGLLMALQALGVKRGDEVIVPVNTFIATAEAVSYLGAVPRFVDCEENTALCDIKAAAEAVTRKTKALIPVHLFGQMCDMGAILTLAKKARLKVLEDASQAHLATYKSSFAGSMGHAGSFSFYPGKNLGAYGEAGAVVTNDAVMAKMLRLMRNHGSASKYEHALVGFNFRMDAIQAAVLRVKFKYLRQWTHRRRAIAARYQQILRGVGDLQFIEERSYGKAVYHLLVARTARRDALLEWLKQRGIGAGVHYPVPLHLQPAYRSLGYRKGSFPVAERLASEIISLPVFPEMTDRQVAQVCAEIRRFYK